MMFDSLAGVRSWLRKLEITLLLILDEEEGLLLCLDLRESSLREKKF